MTLKKTITNVHLTYEMLGEECMGAGEYHRAIKVALCGDDPALQMSPAAKRTYDTLSTRHNYSLPPLGKRIKDRATKLSAELKSEGVDRLRAVSVCNTVKDAAEFYASPSTTYLERMTVAQFITDMVLDLVGATENTIGEGESFASLHKHMQTLHVEDPSSDRFKAGVDNVVYLRDYLTNKSEGES